MKYDIIGDIHGHVKELKKLLIKLGYRDETSGWQHPEDRIAIFLGDFIDRGLYQLETVSIVKAMVNSGAARAVLGNHELNAMAWHTPDGKGDYLRPRYRTDKNYNQHKSFLDELDYRHDEPEYTEYQRELHAEIIDWFFTLPLWIEEPGLGIVHACWHKEYMDYLRPYLNEDLTLPRNLLATAVTEPDYPTNKNDQSIFKAVETLLKGPEVFLPDGHSFKDKDGINRNMERVKWWMTDVTSNREKSMPGNDNSTMPAISLPEQMQLKIPEDKVVFFGHYWFTGEPRLSGRTITCLDFSVAKNGYLTAYRFDGENELSETKLISVQVIQEK